MEKDIFDAYSTLGVISIEDDLMGMYQKSYPLKKDETYKSLMQDAKDGKLEPEHITYLEGFYDNIISLRTSFVERYKAFLGGSDVPAIAKATRPANKPAAASKPVEKAAPTKVKRLPKEYNKKRILEDIKENGGVPTEFHKAMLALNKLKNVRASLNAKGKRHRYDDTNEMSVENCRILIAAIKAFESKIATMK